MKRLLLHIAFWLVYVIQDALLIFTWVGPSLGEMPDDQRFFMVLQDVLIMLIPKLLLCYFILYVSLKKLLAEEGNTLRIAVEIFAVLAVSLVLYRVLLKFIVIPYIFNNAIKSGPLFNVRNLLMAFMDIGCVVGLAAFIKFVRIQLRYKEREKTLVKQKLEAELKFLRNQTNPHFLFNTLNNIYGLARRKSELTANVVLKLSKLLRFMLYESKKDLISISDEVKVLENYIDLESIRYTDMLTVKFNKNIDNESEEIAPLLLLPFVENAFKHGASESHFDAMIYIDLQLADGNLTFTVENTKEATTEAIIKENIGLANVKRQLELLYKEHNLHIENQANLFRVVVTVNLKSYAKI
ncbi:MAG TPA: histidine kinase [Chitinophagaceae bacterium]|nr:histidine kinase [Chitinophagaceae bacterium]